MVSSLCRYMGMSIYQCGKLMMWPVLMDMVKHDVICDDVEQYHRCFIL